MAVTKCHRLIFLVILIVTTFHAELNGSVISMNQGDWPQPEMKDPEEKWGYVEVRSDAHMFWWLYETTSKQGYENSPLVIWLQGGPGGSSTGFGNFEEIGPLDVNLDARSTTWLSAASLLFIDNPVGTGYSYVTSDNAYATNNSMIAADLVTTLTAFYKHNPQFQKIPLYIFSESYGGKMTAGFGVALHQAIQAGSIACNFQGVAMGDSWISALDYVLTWGPYLYATSLLDEEGLAAINASAMQCKSAYEAGNYTSATSLWGQTENVVEAESGGVNFYNILHWGEADAQRKQVNSAPKSNLEYLYNHHVKPLQNDPLSELMNGPIRQKLGVIPDTVTWGGQSGGVFANLSEDFMKPVIDSVDYLLENTDVKVVVYNGQLDLICNTIGTSLWVQKLKWSGLTGYNSAPRKTLTGLKKGNIPWGFLKHYKNFNFYWILDAGHMVPSDVGESALKMLKDVTGAKN